MTTPTCTIVAVARFLTRHERFTRAEFTLGVGMVRSAAERLITRLHKARVIHIDEWMDDSMGRASIAVFAVGAGRDAPRRNALSGKARSAAYNAHRKQAGVVALATVMTAWGGAASERNTCCV